MAADESGDSWLREPGFALKGVERTGRWHVWEGRESTTARATWEQKRLRAPQAPFLPVSGTQFDSIPLALLWSGSRVAEF